MIPAIAMPQPAQAAAAQPSTVAAEAKHRKLTAAAQQFEAMFLQQMMKPFREKAGGDSDDGSSDSGGSSTYQSLGVESMAQAISAAGGFGIARSIVASVERQASENLSSGKK
jgi:Rod binding domain-containing protein